jgi:hypothetical protein
VTMILSVISARYALQISDRLLSQKRANQYEPWDPASNKSVILLGHDGLISMGYSGPAFISRATTDGWIAEVLTGMDLGASRSRPNFGHQLGSGVPDRVVYAHLNTVTDGLNEAARARQVDHTLDLYCVGLRWNSLKKPVWPAIGRITWDRARRCYGMAMSKRRWGWESGQSYQFAASGRSEAEARKALRERLPRIDIGNKDEAVATLIGILRSLPPQDTTVGRDCLVTTIQREPPHVHVKYEAYDIKEIRVAFTGRTVTLPASFSPWILTPRFLAAPQAISGPGWKHTSDGFEFSVEGSGRHGDVAIMSSQPRRPR